MRNREQTMALFELAYGSGMTARKRGAARGENPYTPGTDGWNWWDGGWDEIDAKLVPRKRPEPPPTPRTLFD